jgi:hypothetical protein
VGATPRYQQLALLVGVFISVIAIGYTLQGMNKALEQFKTFPARAFDVDHPPVGVEVQRGGFDRERVRIITDSNQIVEEPGNKYWILNSLGSSELPDGKYLYNPQTKQIEVQWIQGIGGEKAPAPQARLMATIISGILNHRLPWGLVLIGVFMVIGVELLGIRSLSFAVGFYISIGTTLVMFVGGVIRWLVERNMAKAGEIVEDSEVSAGSLYASGLIAAGGIVGLLGIGIKLLEDRGVIKTGALIFEFTKNPTTSKIIAVITCAALAFSLYHFARKPLEENKK